MCVRCVMDTTDPVIQFDENGECNHCKEYENVSRRFLFTGEAGQRKLQDAVHAIKEQGSGKPYDCVIGLSGGLDSTFVACKVKQLGLRPLAVHLDNGWDSELAVSNIERIVKKLDIDLYTLVLDWEEFRDLQVVFLKASTPDSEIPTDHAIIATLYRVAIENNVKYIISGGNIATELTMPRYWSHGHHDWRYIRSLHRLFEAVPLKTFPHYTWLDLIKYHRIMGMKVIRILNFMNYVRKEAMVVVERELGWRDYGAKHYESVYTRFYQGYILHVKFNIDKRKAHYSTLICSGQMTREEALQELQKEVYPPDRLKEDMEFVPKKLGLTPEKFARIMALPPKTFWDYPSYENALPYRAARSVYRFVKRGILQITRWFKYTGEAAS